tara:strand:- start:94 stop:759 length:666 start_codon:yes stop_codon:yes gene_type:complete
MKLIKYVSSIFISLLILTRLASAEVAMGVTGTLAMVDAEGNETEGTAADTSNRKASADNTVVYGSIFIEHVADNGFAIGISYNPFSADVSDQTHERTETSVAGSGEGVTGSNTRKASAEVENYMTAYIEIPFSAAYLKAGVAQIDVKTGENALTNGGTYGDATLDGYIVGLGMRRDAGDYFWKISADYVDFDELSLNSSTNNSIKADLDVTEINFSIGKAF